MPVTPLTGTQQAALVGLVRVGRLETVPPDPVRAASFLQQAEERISQIPLLTSPAVRYGIAYDACHDVGEALLAAYGYRTKSGPGQHEAVGRAMRAILDRPPADAAATQFDRLRRVRNQDATRPDPSG